jgi:hypothetical protein
MSITSSTSDEPVPGGVGPLAIRAADPVLPAPGATTVAVRSASGAAFDLANQANRLRAWLTPADAGTVSVAGGRVTVTADRRAVLTVAYQRKLADGSYRDVANRYGGKRVPVRVTVPVVPR